MVDHIVTVSTSVFHKNFSTFPNLNYTVKPELTNAF